MNNCSPIKAELLQRFGSEAEAARQLGWPRQRLNRLTNCVRQPKMSDLTALGRILEKPPSEVVKFFLPDESPNG
jgi:hypothetical protein